MASNLRLCDAHALGSGLLRQPEAAHGLPDFDNQARLDLVFFRIGQTQICIQGF
jgi:hypothetical protein